MHAYAFDNPYTQFYSCNSGTGGEDSIAQAWVNQTGGQAKAVVDGTTNYTNMNIMRFWQILKFMDKAIAKEGRKELGFSISGSVNYPTNSKGIEWELFEPCDIE